MPDLPPIHRLGSIPSTMDHLHRLAEQGAPAGTAVVAAEQTAGRGSRGRQWHSPRGGLWLSVLVRPERDGVELLSLRAGLAIAESLDQAGGEVALKWPNDLMWGERKIGGVLCEARWVGDTPAWVAIGAGLNVRNSIPPELAGTAAALAERLPQATPERILELVLPALRLLDTATGRLGPAEQGRLAGRDWLRGRALQAPSPGVAAGIAPDGALRIRRADGTTAEVRAGPVELADRSASP
jgi:BirA family biotin operon repressor/biotin-[acetyl-CoA-carboxylase] ligase